MGAPRSGELRASDLLLWRAVLTDAYMGSRWGVPVDLDSTVHRAGMTLLFDHDLNLAEDSPGTGFEVGIAALDGDIGLDDDEAPRFTQQHMQVLQQKYERIRALLSPAPAPAGTARGRGRARPAQRQGYASGEEAGPITGGAPDNAFPVLVLSNLESMFGSNTNWLGSDHKNAIAKDVAGKISKYLDVERYNIMVVITAPVYRTSQPGRSLKKRQAMYEELHANPACFECGRWLTGAEKIVYAHFYDPKYERDIDEDTVERACQVVFKKEDSTDFDPGEIVESIVANRIGVVFFVGGETHWLHRQLRLFGFETALQTLREDGVKLVLAGNSAGCINLGASTYITASKSYADGRGSYFNERDDVLGNLCDENGKILDLPPSMDSNECPPATVKVCDRDIPIHYDGLRAAPYTFYPHFKNDRDGILSTNYHLTCTESPEGSVLFIDESAMCYISESSIYTFYHRETYPSRMTIDRLNDYETMKAETMIDEIQRSPVEYGTEISFIWNIRAMQQRRHMYSFFPANAVDTAEILHTTEHWAEDSQPPPSEGLSSEWPGGWSRQLGGRRSAASDPGIGARTNVIAAAIGLFLSVAISTLGR